MNVTNTLAPALKKLRLSGVLETLDLRLKQAAEGNLDYVEFLIRLLDDEIERRESKQLALRLRRASFDHERTLEDFDFSFNPKIPKGQIIDLATCAFVDRAENVLLIGPAGVGKSHVAQALGHRACRFGHKVLYTSAQDMLRDLHQARADHSYDRKLLRYTTPDLLVIDDLGLHPLTHHEPIDLFEIVRQRYEKRATVYTSNRSIEEWAAIFRDELLASAAVDRILHNAHVIVMEGDTYRNPPPGRRRVKAASVVA